MSKGVWSIFYIIFIVFTVFIVGMTFDTSSESVNANIAGQAPGFQKPKVGTAGGMVVAVIKSQIGTKDAPLGDPDLLVHVTSDEECTGDDCDEDDSDAVTEQDSSTKDGGSKDGVHGDDCPADMLC